MNESNEFSSTDEEKKSVNLTQEQIKEYGWMMTNVGVGEYDRLHFLDKAPDEILLSVEFQKAAKYGFKSSLIMLSFFGAKLIAEKFKLSKEYINEIVSEQVKRYLEAGHASTAERLIKEFNFPQELLKDTKFKKAAKSAILDIIARGNYSDKEVEEITKKYGLSKEDTVQAVKNGLEKFIEISDKTVSDIKGKFNIK